MRNLKQPFQDNTGTGGDVTRRSALLGMAGVFSLVLTALPIKSAVHAGEAKTGTPEQSEIIMATKREAWKNSKENGGTLVIWYDARHHQDAMEMVQALKMLGRQNVTALAGREDGAFVLIGNGRTVPHKFTLQEARDGTLGDEAMIFADEQNISFLDVENTVSEGNHLTARMA